MPICWPTAELEDLLERINELQQPIDRRERIEHDYYSIYDSVPETQGVVRQ